MSFLANFEQKIIKNKPKALVSVCFGVFFTAFYIWFRSFSFMPQQVLSAFFVGFMGIWLCFEQSSKVQKINAVLFSALISFFLVARYTIVTESGEPLPWGVRQLLYFAVLLFFLSFITNGAFNFVKKIDIFDKSGERITKKSFYIYFAILTVFWLPYFISYGPVKVSADSASVIDQALDGILNDGFPIMYTLLLRLFLNFGLMIGNIQIGAAVFGFLSMLFLAAAFAYSIYWMRKKGASLIFVTVALIYFASSPVWPINGFTIWKDTPFNATLLIYMLYCYDIIESKGELLNTKKGMINFVIISVALCFLRGNGWPIVLLVCAVLTLIYRVNFKRLVPVFAVILIGVKIITGPVYGMFGIYGLGAVESMAVPIQQIAYSVKNGAVLTEGQDAFLSQIIEPEKMAELYRNTTVNDIKFNADFNTEFFNQNTSEFMKVWLELLPQNVESYLNAWLLETRGFWQVAFPETAFTAYDVFNPHRGITSKSDIVENLTGINFNAIIEMNNKYITLATAQFFIIFCALFLLSNKKAAFALPLLISIVIWLGLMIGAPVYRDFRYLMIAPMAIFVTTFITLKAFRLKAFRLKAYSEKTDET